MLITGILMTCHVHLHERSKIHLGKAQLESLFIESVCFMCVEGG